MEMQGFDKQDGSTARSSTLILCMHGLEAMKTSVTLCNLENIVDVPACPSLAS